MANGSSKIHAGSSLVGTPAAPEATALSNSLPLIPAPGTESETRDHRVPESPGLGTLGYWEKGPVPTLYISHRQKSPGGLVAPTWAHGGARCLLEGLSLAEGASIERGWVGAGPSTLLPAPAAAIGAG